MSDRLSCGSHVLGSQPSLVSLILFVTCTTAVWPFVTRGLPSVCLKEAAPIYECNCTFLAELLLNSLTSGFQFTPRASWWRVRACRISPIADIGIAVARSDKAK